MLYLLALTLLFAPTYAIRMHGLGLPGNVLMLWVGVVWIAFFANLLIKKQFAGFITYVKSLDKKTVAFIALFFLAGFLADFIKGVDSKKIGSFIVLFVQPMSLFFIFGYISRQKPEARDLFVKTCYVFLAFAGLYAAVQYYTLAGLPHQWWGNSVEPKRAIAFFVHPNFYALFAAPLLAFLLPDLMGSVKHKVLRIKNLKNISWLIGMVGLILSLSRAGWLGLAAAIAVYFFVAADKKIKQAIGGAVIVIVMIIVITPNLRWRFIKPFYGETSASSRLTLWKSGAQAIKQSPIFGLGLNGYSNNYRKFISASVVAETHNFPHNIFLDLWVETGLLGLLSFIGIGALYIFRGLWSIPLLSKERLGEVKAGARLLEADQIFKLSIALFLICLLVQGQIDNPYFKNDLAMVFWIVLSLAF